MIWISPNFAVNSLALFGSLTDLDRCMNFQATGIFLILF